MFFFFFRPLALQLPTKFREGKNGAQTIVELFEGATFGHKDEPNQSEGISEQISEMFPDLSTIHVKPRPLIAGMR